MLFLWIGFGVVAALAANARGRSFWMWLLVGILTGVFGLIAVLVMPRVEGRAYQMKPERPPSRLVHGVIDVPPPSVVRRPKSAVQVVGDGYFDFDVVGEASYQDALDRIAGGRARGGHHLDIEVVLKPESNNPHDPNAVAVWCGHRKIAYLARSDARRYRDALAGQGFGVLHAQADAVIVGGWSGEQNDSNYGVRLDMTMPPVFERIN